MKVLLVNSSNGRSVPLAVFTADTSGPRGLHWDPTPPCFAFPPTELIGYKTETQHTIAQTHAQLQTMTRSETEKLSLASSTAGPDLKWGLREETLLVAMGTEACPGWRLGGRMGSKEGTVDARS